MAGHLLNAGYDLRVHNRTKNKALSLMHKGAIWCESAADAAEGADFVFSIVGFQQDVEEYLADQSALLGLGAKSSLNMLPVHPSHKSPKH